MDIKNFIDEELSKVEKFVGSSLNIEIKKSGSSILIDTHHEEQDVHDVRIKDVVEHGHLLWKENVDKIVMWLVIIGSVLFEIYFIKQFAIAFYSFDRSYIENMILYVPVLFLVSFILTLNENFNYIQLKMKCYKTGLLMAGIKLVGLLYYFISDFSASVVRFIVAFGSFSMDRTVLLGYGINGAILALATILIYKTFEDGFDDVCKRFESYKLGKEIGPKINEHEYSAEYIKTIENKKPIRIPEKDRMLHLGIVGATGTGKTATAILPLVLADLKKKFKNINYIKKRVFKMIKKGEFEITEPFDDNDFSFDKIRPTNSKKSIKEYEKLKKIRPCGLTVVGPDDSLSDNVYDMAKLFNFKVNRIDPLPDSNGKYKEGYMGMNPLHISDTIPEWALDRERIKRATLFADVMQFVYELKGKSDPYFSSINRVGTTYISLLLMITMPIVNKRHPNPIDVQRLLNDFDKIIPYYNVLKRISKKNNNKYEVIVTAVFKDFIEENGRKVFEQHSRGLKTQLNDFLTDTFIVDLFSAEKVVDFDKILRDGDITVVNIELGQLGSVNAPALGLFVSMLMNNAVLGRPGTENTRMPHFLYYDEFPVFASPALEGAFTLYRKFRVGLTVAMQTTDQMNKTSYLSYMKGVILNSCRSLVFFGGANVSDMELVNKMGGIGESAMTQRTTSHSSITVENPYVNFSERITAVEKDNVSASDVRYTDFKEVHYFYTVDGNPMPVVKGRLDFVKKSELRKRKKKVYDFMKYYKPSESETVESVEENEQTSVETGTAKDNKNIESEVLVKKDDKKTSQETEKNNKLDFDPQQNIFKVFTESGNKVIGKVTDTKIYDRNNRVEGELIDEEQIENKKSSNVNVIDVNSIGEIGKIEFEEE